MTEPLRNADGSQMDLDQMWAKFQSMMDDITKGVANMFGGTRDNIKDINTIQDVIRLIKSSENIIVLTGAGISVSCGIPDFRGANGLYKQLKEKYNLTKPETMFDLEYFMRNPRLFYSFAKEIHPGFEKPKFLPSKTHKFIKILENKHKLLRNYTQNIDTLESMMGIEKVITCHGSFKSASCVNCGYKVNGKEIENHITSETFALCPYCHPNKSNLKKDKQRKCNDIVEKKKGFVSIQIPKVLLTNEDIFGFEAQCTSLDECEKNCTLKVTKRESDRKWIRLELESDDAECLEMCTSEVMHWLQSFESFGIMKSDIVFFGESLSEDYEQMIEEDVKKCDLMIVIGTSLKVAPVSSIPCKIGKNIPCILVNKELCRWPDMKFDVNLLGHCDDICETLMDELKWEWMDKEKTKPRKYENVKPNHYIFPFGQLPKELHLPTVDE